MPIPSVITDLSATAGSNSPQGSESPTEGDNYLRAIQAIMRREHDDFGTASSAGVGAGMVGFATANTYATASVGWALKAYIGGFADSSTATVGDALVAVKRTASGSVATTLHTWIERTAYNVKDFGAVGDGATDDTSAIQACINAAQTAGSTVGGAVVYFPPSSNYYRITSALVVTGTGLRLCGGGQGSMIYNNGTGNTLQIGNDIDFISNVHVCDLNLQTNVSSANLILVRKAPNTRIDRCVFSHAGTGGHGIRMTESWCSTVSNCAFGSIQGYGLHASESANAMLISGNRFDGLNTSSTCGILVDGAGNAIVCNTVQTWATCINLKSFLGGVVSGNYFETYGTGILGDTGTAGGYDIRGNYFAPSGSTVVSIKLTAGNNIKIGPNHYGFTHTGGAPIELTAATRVFIESGQDHVDNYTVKWPRDHASVWLQHMEDEDRGFTQGYSAAVTHTGTTSETTLKTYTGTKEDWGTGTRIDVRVAGRITGTNNTKDIRLKLAGTTIGTVSEAAGATDDWIIEASIDVASATVGQAVVKAWQGSTVEVGDVVQGGGVTLALDTTNPTITVTGQLGNTGDAIIVTHWMIELRN